MYCTYENETRHSMDPVIAHLDYSYIKTNVHVTLNSNIFYSIFHIESHMHDI